MTRVVRVGLVLIATLASGPALSQAMPGSTVGLTATGLPANPFASNYPSEPPRMQPDRSVHPAGRHRAARRSASGSRTVEPLRPPADIPAARPRR